MWGIYPSALLLRKVEASWASLIKDLSFYDSFLDQYLISFGGHSMPLGSKSTESDDLNVYAIAAYILLLMELL